MCHNLILSLKKTVAYIPPNGYIWPNLVTLPMHPHEFLNLFTVQASLKQGDQIGGN
jgi:hypothetical protein